MQLITCSWSIFLWFKLTSNSVHDAAIIANGDPIKIPNGLPVYGPDLAAGFAKNIGTYRQEPVPPKSGGYNNGEFGTIINGSYQITWSLTIQANITQLTTMLCLRFVSNVRVTLFEHPFRY